MDIDSYYPHTSKEYLDFAHEANRVMDCFDGAIGGHFDSEHDEINARTFVTEMTALVY